MNKLISTLALIAFSRFVSAAIEPNIMQAADQRDARALNHLGVISANDHGVPADYKEAMKRFRLAADQGNANAQYNLGVAYDNGRGDYDQMH